jgi:hypothetical protein
MDYMVCGFLSFLRTRVAPGWLKTSVLSKNIIFGKGMLVSG